MKKVKITRGQLLAQLVFMEKQLFVYRLLFGELDFKNYDVMKVIDIAEKLKPYREKIIEEYEKGKR